jgi:hypothetical protein
LSPQNTLVRAIFLRTKKAQKVLNTVNILRNLLAFNAETGKKQKTSKIVYKIE